MFHQKKNSIKGNSRIDTSAFNEKKSGFPYSQYLKKKANFPLAQFEVKTNFSEMKPVFIVLTLHMFSRWKSFE